MELVAIVSVLWARRVAVGLGLVAAAAVGLVLMGISRASAAPTWEASAQVLIDTKHSQLVNVAPAGVSVISTRALLIADLMGSDQMRALISGDADIPAGQLEVLGPWSRAAPEVLTPLVVKDARFSTPSSGRYVLSLYADGQSSVISIDTDAPDAGQARTLAKAAISVLRSPIAAGKGFVVDTVAPATTVEVPGHSRRRLVAVVGSLAAFALWCVLVVVVAGIGGRVRRAQLV